MERSIYLNFIGAKKSNCIRKLVKLSRKMILAHIFLPAMLLVICRSQQVPSHLQNPYGNEENVYGGLSHASDPITSTLSSNSDELLDRYRQLTAESLMKLYDSCKVHDFLQNLKHNMENDIGK